MSNDDGSVRITQYVRPHGRKRHIEASVRPELADKAHKLGLIFSTEVLSTGEVAIYCRRYDEDVEDERLELCNNVEGAPRATLEKLIENEREPEPHPGQF